MVVSLHEQEPLQSCHWTKNLVHRRVRAKQFRHHAGQLDSHVILRFITKKNKFLFLSRMRSGLNL